MHAVVILTPSCVSRRSVWYSAVGQHCTHFQDFFFSKFSHFDGQGDALFAMLEPRSRIASVLNGDTAGLAMTHNGR